MSCRTWEASLKWRHIEVTFFSEKVIFKGLFVVSHDLMILLSGTGGLEHGVVDTHR